MWYEEGRLYRYGSGFSPSTGRSPPPILIRQFKKLATSNERNGLKSCVGNFSPAMGAI